MNEIVDKKFKVNKVIYYDESKRWGALGTNPIDNLGKLESELANAFGSIGIAGNFGPVYEGAVIKVCGSIVDNPKFGKQIQVKTLEVIADSESAEGIRNFLVNSFIEGISIQNAKKIYNVFKKDSINVVLNDTDKLLSINGIGKKTVKKIKESVSYYQERQEFFEFCANLGMKYAVAMKIVDTLGDDSINIIKEDPYKLLELVPTLSFSQVDELYLKQGGLETSKRRLHVGFLHVLRLLVTFEGSTGCLSRKLKSKFLTTLSLSKEDYYSATLQELVNEDKVECNRAKILGVDEVVVYYKEYVDVEREISTRLGSLMSNIVLSSKVKPEIVEEEIKDFPFTLNEQQVKAVHDCLKNNVAILTGSAGCLTGDTEISFSRAKSQKRRKLADLYKAFNGLPLRGSHGFRPGVKSYVRSYIESEGFIKLNEVKNIVYSGKKQVYLLTLEDGKTLKATATHEILTNRGFVKLINLSTSDYVMVDNLKKHQKKVDKSRGKKTRDRLLCVGSFHPFAKNHRGIKNKADFRIEIHRAIYEAHINNLTLSEYREATKHPNKLKFVDPEFFHIHHKDHDHYNNSIENLEKVPRKEHYVMHSKGAYNHFGHGIPEFSRVVSVEKLGIEDTYDICCYENHNFSANNIIVHNSGKSSITKALYKIYLRSGYNTVLLAPTAKACRRLEECTGGEASTIHKYLCLFGDDSTWDSYVTAPEDCVYIIDEASMLDILLLRQLLKGATPSTRVLFVGDNNQLPSVQAGNILGDLISSGKVHVSILTDVMRQQEDSHIIKFSTMTNNGQIFEPCSYPDFHYEEFGESNELRDFFYNEYVKAVKEYGISQVQVITPYKRGDVSMNNLNKFLQSCYNKNTEELLEHYKLGDRVRHTRNNYQKSVYNGETGIIVDFQDGELIVDYGDRTVNYSSKDLDELTLSYVATVHASQGSEYAVCFVILDDTVANDFLLIRRLLYTAITRGKKKVYVLSKPYLVDKCITNDSYRPRITRLKEFMKVLKMTLYS